MGVETLDERGRFSAAETAAAVTEARARVGARASIEDWIRGALRACRR